MLVTVTVTVRIRVRVWVRVRVRVRVRIKVRVRVSVRLRVANCCIQTAGEGDKMRINHVIKSDQWRCAPQIRPAPHFVVSPFTFHSLYTAMFTRTATTFHAPAPRVGALSDDARLKSVCLASVCRVHRAQVKNRKD